MKNTLVPFRPRIFRGTCPCWYPKYEADNNPRRYHKYLRADNMENIYGDRVGSEEETPVEEPTLTNPAGSTTDAGDGEV